MTDTAAALLLFAATALVLHLLSAALTIWRTNRTPRGPAPRPDDAVSLLRPVCGIDPHDRETLATSFALEHRNLDILFCAETPGDPAAGLVRELIAAHPQRTARLLIGDERPTANPKLNNLVKGWRAARAPWIIMADSNVVLPSDYVAQLMRKFDSGTGLVCSPPVGSRPEGFWAEIECAFLNTHQARWQLAADSIGFGFAQGKSMLWRQDVLERGGGIEALGRDAAEDAAATKLVRAQGLSVRLVDRPFEQPLGPRSARQVWDRQVRWARLRRATFPLYYAPEVLTGAVLPTASVALAAGLLDIDAAMAALLFAGAWYGVEALTARAAGWHMSAAQPVAWIARDVLLPVLWVQGLTGSTFVWRGNEMTVAEPAQTLATDRPGTV